jgi:Cu/Ag efflux protein CusF
MRQNRLFRTSLLAAAVGVAFAGAFAALPAFAQQQATAPPRTTEQTVEATAQVVDIDQAKREVTLEDEDGDKQTVVVGPEVQRLDEVAVGDTIRVRYTIGVTSELRAPTAEEKAEPFVALEGGGRSPEGTAPAGGAARMFRIVATIDSMDKVAETATLKGPNGNMVTVKVQDPSLLDKAKVGDSVVVTAAESVALSVEKVNPNMPKSKEK